MTEVQNTDLVATIEATAATYAFSSITSTGLRRTVEIARGLHELKKLLTDHFLERVILPLAGTGVGFKTDKVYGIDVHRDVLTQALMHGLLPIGNQYNVIAGNLYITKEGCQHKLLAHPQVRAYNAILGNPEPSPHGKDTWLVAGAIDWIDSDGCPHLLSFAKTAEIDNRIPVRANAGQGPDALIGKAKRKALARLLERLDGMPIPDGDLGDEPRRPEMQRSHARLAMELDP